MNNVFKLRTEKKTKGEQRKTKVLGVTSGESLPQTQLSLLSVGLPPLQAVYASLIGLWSKQSGPTLIVQLHTASSFLRIGFSPNVQKNATNLSIPGIECSLKIAVWWFTWNPHLPHPERLSFILLQQ